VANDVFEAVQRGEETIKPVFDDIKKLKDSKVKQLVKELDAQQLVIALKDAETELVEKVLPNLNKITRKKYDEIAENIGKVSKAEVKKVRSQIENQLKKLF
jgi:flagellar motor switch protein FliG